MQHKNLIHFQEIANLINSIPKQNKRIKWACNPKICAKIAKIILENNIDPKEIYSFCVINNINVSLTVFYYFPRGFASMNKIWEELIEELYNLNIEPCENFRTTNRIKSIYKPNVIPKSYQKKEIKVRFSITSEVYQLLLSKIINHN